MMCAMPEPPLRPPIAVGVGATGHRSLPDMNDKQLRSRVTEILGIVRHAVERLRNAPECAYAKGEPVFRIVSALAAGADQILADEATRATNGFILHAPLPFDDETYRRDFDGDSDALNRYRELLQRAKRTLEICGPSRESHQRGRSYEAVGITVLAHSDILLAVWDGNDTRGRGATGDVVRMAVRQGIPVVWIGAEAPHLAGLLDFSDGRPVRGTLDQLEDAIRDLLHAPPPRRAPGARRWRRAADPREVFLRERSPEWPAGRDLGMRIARGYRSLWNGFFRVLSRDGRRGTPVKKVETGREDLPPDSYRSFQRLVDGLAVHYAAMYRSSFLINYVLGASAVTLALLAYAWDPLESAFVMAEIAVIAVMLLNFARARAGMWQDKSTDYRQLAEQFRQMIVLGPLGLVTPFPRRQPFHRIDPTDTWMSWYFRAVVRKEGMARAKLDGEYLAECRRRLHDDLVREQLRYHRESAARHRTLRHVLHVFAVSMFSLAGVFCAAHLVPAVFPSQGWIGAGGVHWLHEHRAWLTLLAAALPAWGAAAHAVSSQSEARRLAERSSSMVEVLGEFDRELSAEESSSLDLMHHAGKVAQVMLDEVVDWRVIYQAPETVLT